MDGVPISLIGMSGVVSGQRSIYFFILALENVADQVIGSAVRSGEIQNPAFYGALLLSQVHASGAFQHKTGNLIKASEIRDLVNFPNQGAPGQLLAGGQRGKGAVFV